MKRYSSSLAAGFAVALTVLAGPTAALAVTLSDPKNSKTGVPLEPYLITFLLPVFGIVIAAVSYFVDRRIRATHTGNFISVTHAEPGHADTFPITRGG